MTSGLDLSFPHSFNVRLPTDWPSGADQPERTGQEAAQARGETVDVRALTTAANTIRRLLADLGITSRRRGRA